MIIDYCKPSDIDKLMIFFRDNWKQEHMLSCNKEFILIQYFDETNNRLNIVAAWEDNEIIGILTFQPNTFFDKTIENKFVWLNNWLVKKDANKGVSLALLKSVMDKETKHVGTVGNNEVAGNIYKALKFKTGILKQYFIPNNVTKTFNILKGYIKGENMQNKVGPKLLTDIPQTSFNPNPQKSLEYIKYKYIKNPYYKYHVCGTDVGGLVFKIINHNGSKLLRIVEMYGDISILNGYLQPLMEQFGAEYADLFVYGIEDSLLTNLDFILNDGKYITPCYFEPFLNENVDIHFAYNSDNFVIFKGDGDREYPNLYTLNAMEDAMKGVRKWKTGF